ncbi:MAG TPA: amidohydrolase family protein [Acidimicrobiales bacterium]|nr:amidohydrolase family protein [Acidimicrobiales bacterium]
MPPRSLGFPVFDADNHLYETRDALTRYLPDEHKGVIDYVEMQGRTKIVVRGQISNYIPNPTFEVVAAPGAQEEYFKHGNPEGKSPRQIMGRGIQAIPAYREPAPRLELLDELGIARAMVYPTLASLVEERMRDDPDLIHVVIHAFNRWLHEQWSFNYEGRLFATPVVSLPIVERALEELEWVLERGARAVLVRPAPVPGLRGPRSFALTEFDPFWARVQESGIFVVLHASDSGYTRYVNEWEGNKGEYLAFQPSPFSLVSMGHRPIEDTVASMCCHGLLSRFADLKFAIVENGSSWVPTLFQSLDDVYSKMPQEFAEHPVEAFKRNCYLHPFHEENPLKLIGELGSDHVMFGSDYPHPEGMSDPLSYVDELDGLPGEDKAKIMGGNIARLVGIGVGT